METKTIIKSLSIAQLNELRKEIEEEILERANNKVAELKNTATINLVSLVDKAISINDLKNQIGADGIKLLKGLLNGKD